MAGKLRYWKEKDGRFWARMAVPAPVRRIIGKSEIIEPLGGDRRVAVKAHPAAVARLQAQIAAAEAQLEGVPVLETPVTTTDFARVVWDRYNDALARDDRERATLPTEDQIEAERVALIDRAERGEIEAHPAAILDASLDLLVRRGCRRAPAGEAGRLAQASGEG